MKLEPSLLFSTIRVRSLLGMLVLAFATVVGAVFLWPQLLTMDQAPVPNAVLGLAIYVLFAGFLWLACLRAGVLGQISLGPRPSWSEVRVYILLGIPLAWIAVVGLYTLYLPLSFVFPTFVTSMLIEVPPLILWRADFEGLLANGINALLLVVIGPALEEIVFRGFLLNRLWRKYGIHKAVIYSSIAFAILHVEIIGGLVFGIVLSLIYIRTKSLIGPIVAHASNNLIGLLVVVFEGVVYSDMSETTLEEFQAQWWLAVIGLAIGVPWLVWFCKRLFRPEFDTA